MTRQAAPGARSGEVYEFGPFRLDALERRLLRGDAQVPLTPKVFDVLLLLVQNSGRLLEKEHLIREIWPDTVVEEGSLTRNVSTLRQVLGPGPEGKPYIETVSKHGYRFVGKATRLAAAPPARSIAVLPFKNLGTVADETHLGFGIADTLITRLSNIEQLVVRPTSAVLTYGEPGSDPLAAGCRLLVESVLDGHVQRSGDRLRVTVQLLNVRDGRVLWAAQFDEEFKEVFAVQDSISARVARELELKLTGDQASRLTRHGTASTEAYQLFIKGRYLLHKYASFDVAFECLRRAIACDPSYAPAYAELAFGHFTVGPYVMPVAETLGEARRLVDRALGLDPTLASAQTTRAMIASWIDWDRTAGEQAFRETIGLNPNHPTAHHGYGWLLAAMGRFAEARVELELARSFDPLSPSINVDLGLPYFFERDFARAAALFEQAADIDPYFWWGHRWLGLAYGMMGEASRAIGELHKAVERSQGMIPDTHLSLAWAQALAGEGDAAEEILARFADRSQPPWISAYEVAAVHVALGERGQPFDWLEQARRERDRWLGWIAVDPRFDALRDDRRFQVLLHEAGFAGA